MACCELDEAGLLCVRVSWALERVACYEKWRVGGGRYERSTDAEIGWLGWGFLCFCEGEVEVVMVVHGVLSGRGDGWCESE